MVVLVALVVIMLVDACRQAPPPATRLSVGAVAPDVGRDVSPESLPDVSATTDLPAPTTSTSTSTTARSAPRTTVAHVSRGDRRTVGVLGRFEATCYSLTGRTATGSPAGPGAIAVDPRVIPLGTRLRVEGYGAGVAVDTGRLIKGNRIDVWKESGCLGWGRRWVTVEALG